MIIGSPVLAVDCTLQLLNRDLEIAPTVAV